MEPVRLHYFPTTVTVGTLRSDGKRDIEFEVNVELSWTKVHQRSRCELKDPDANWTKVHHISKCLVTVYHKWSKLRGPQWYCVGLTEFTFLCMCVCVNNFRAHQQHMLILKHYNISSHWNTPGCNLIVIEMNMILQHQYVISAPYTKWYICFFTWDSHGISIMAFVQLPLFSCLLCKEISVLFMIASLALAWQLQCKWRNPEGYE